MAKIMITGASDDLIELEGDITEEFGCYDEETSYLSFNDGTVLSVEYDKTGCWRINRVAKGTASYKKEDATDPDGDYTDHVTLEGDIATVVYGTKLARASTVAAK